MAGSTTVPPAATRARLSMSASASVTLSLSRYPTPAFTTSSNWLAYVLSA